MAVSHGTRSCYTQGCRCVDCKKAANDYIKRRRQLQNADKLNPKIAALPAAVDPSAAEPGRVESGVLAEIEGLSTSASRQGLVEIAMALARVLDSPLAIAQHPSAAHRLSETLDKIRKGSEMGKSKLAAVRSMSREATG
jgi:hypothetical protein